MHVLYTVHSFGSHFGRRSLRYYSDMGPPVIAAADPQSAIRIEDYLHVKGVRLVEPGMPQWKIKPLQEKNIELINKYLVSVGLVW